MSGLLPAAVYGLTIPNGDVMIPGAVDFPAAYRITMAAIDPTAEPEFSGSAIDGTTPRATLKLIRQTLDEDDEEDSDYDSDDSDNIESLLDLNKLGSDDDDEDESSEDETNGGPSDPSKSKKAKQAAALEKLKAALANGASDEEMDDAPNGVLSKGKGKAPATGDEESDSDEDSDDIEVEEFVICTLDPTTHYQQPLDIVVGENEKVFFKVSGTHAIFLTGNYVIPVDDTPRGGRGDGLMYPEDDEEDYDLSPDEDELDMDEDEESDDLDDLADPRITELDSEDEEVPKLIKKDKGSKKRAAPDSDDEPALDDVMDKALKAAVEEPKLSKKQQKKLKNNAGQAVKTEAKADAKPDESPSSKKVQFAKNLEQGPTGSKLDTTAKTNGEKVDKKADKAADKPKSTLGVKTVRGVTVDDKKLGSGPAAKKGNKISMRYIGKLTDGKVFDSNKKGKPFQFKLGVGEVIQGWDIGVEGITAGGERRVTIPAKLAYGKQKLPGIPPNSDLIFDIKCLAID